VHLKTNAEVADEFMRRVDLVEQQERAKPNPDPKVLANVNIVRQQIRTMFGDNSSPPPPSPKRSA
jgi:hypothetical protein